MVEIHIPKDSRVFLLEDDPQRTRWFRENLPVDPDIFSNADEAVRHLATSDTYDVMFLDHDLAIVDENRLDPKFEKIHNTGYQVAKSIAENNYLADKTIIHSWNPNGAAAMARVLENAIVIPFGQFEVV